MINKTKRNILITLLLIVLLGTLLRLYLISQESFWLDETATATAVRDYSTMEIFNNAIFHGLVTPGYWEGTITDLPLYFVVLSFWVKLFGVTELTLRLFSALFGLLSIIMVFLVARQITTDKTALASSFIFSLSAVAIQFSQEARLYSFMLFMALCSAYFFIKSLKTGKLAHLSGFAVFSVIGLYTHFSYVFFIFFQVLYTLIALKINQKHVKKAIISFFLIGLLYLPILPRLFQQSAGAGAFLGKPTLFSTAKVLLMLNTWIFPSQELQENIYSLNFSPFAIADWLLILSAIILALFMTAFFIISLLHLKRKSGKKFVAFKNINKIFNDKYFIDDKWMVFLLFWIFVPFLSELLLSILHPTATLFGPINYLLFVFPAYIISVSIGILSLKWRYSRIAIILLAVFSLLPLASYYANADKQQWREAALFMKENLKDDEIILINSPYMNIAFEYYYGKSNRLHPAYSASQAAQLSKNNDSIWLILSFDKYFDPQGTIRKYMESEYMVDKEKNFFDIKILHFTKKKTAGMK